MTDIMRVKPDRETEIRLHHVPAAMSLGHDPILASELAAMALRTSHAVEVYNAMAIIAEGMRLELEALLERRSLLP